MFHLAGNIIDYHVLILGSDHLGQHVVVHIDLGRCTPVLIIRQELKEPAVKLGGADIHSATESTHITRAVFLDNALPEINIRFAF